MVDIHVAEGFVKLASDIGVACGRMLRRGPVSSGASKAADANSDRAANSKRLTSDAGIVSTATSHGTRASDELFDEMSDDDFDCRIDFLSRVRVILTHLDHPRP